MPIRYEWLDEQHTLILISLEGKIVVEDFYVGDARLCEMLDSVHHPVDFISDYSHQHYFAPGYAERVGRMESLFRPNLRFAVFVGNKMLWELFDLYNTNYKQVSFKYGYAETIQEAREWITAMRFDHQFGPRPRYPGLN